MNVQKMTDIDRRRIYVAGPMRGIPAFNYPKFNEAESFLATVGWQVFNPAKIGERFGTPEQINADPALLAQLLKTELDVVRSCHAIFLLRGWEKSAGAKQELAEAIKAGAEVYLADDREQIVGDYIRSTLEQSELKWHVAKATLDRYAGAEKLARERLDCAKRELDKLTAELTAAKEYVGGAK